MKGRCNTLAMFSEGAFSWQAQHFGDLPCHFVWQAQHFRRVVSRSGDKVQIPWQGWHFVAGDENRPKLGKKRRFWGRFVRKLRGKRGDTLHFKLRTWHPTLSPHTAPHFTLYILHSTLHTSHFTLHTLYFTPHTLDSTLYALHFTPHTLHPTLHTLHSTLYALHFTPHTLHPTLYNPHSTL